MHLGHELHFHFRRHAILHVQRHIVGLVRYAISPKLGVLIDSLEAFDPLPDDAGIVKADVPASIPGDLVSGKTLFGGRPFQLNG